MKSTKAAVADGPSSRKQPVRQTRTNPSRSSARMPPTHARDAHAGPPGDQPIEIFPAITHFADSMTALPKELVRQFTLLKEVDAKIYAPEELVFKLIDAATAAPRTDTQTVDDNIPSSAPMSVQGSSAGVAAPSVAPSDSQPLSGEGDLGNASRRQLFHATSFHMHKMMNSMEEKNHVISTANEVLHRQLARIEDVWPYLEGEFSEEAKWGSTTHWAYAENRTGRSNAERARRDGAAAISAAAQALVDEAAARSDARKQAVQAKKNMRNNHNDEEEHDGRHREGAKKPGPAKSRKPADHSVGLGIAPSSMATASKKRKLEKPAAALAALAAANSTVASPVVAPIQAAAGGVPMERALSGVFGSSAGKSKPTSPRVTPAPEQKKRKALPTSSTQAIKKSRNGGTGASPSITSSPVLPSLAEPKVPARASPNPGAASRPASARARQNSLQSNADGSKARPPSSAANKTNGKALETPDPPTSNSWPLSTDPRVTVTKEDSVPPMITEKEPAVKETASASAPPPVEVKKETVTETRERRKSESMPLSSHGMPMVTTKSGRASKPSTPAIATFQEAARVRNARNAESSGGPPVSSAAGSSRIDAVNGNGNGAGPSFGPGPAPKKHQKRASNAGAIMARLAEEAAVARRARGEEDDDPEEPRYCYCNGVSYGEMVACDSDDCSREWFHLACVGLKVAPGSKTKWYCEHCKDRLKMGQKKPNGR